jgi:opacity protein-like surface antigen
MSSTLSASHFSQPLIEIKTGYFFFANSKMRKVYDKGGFDIQLCSSYPLKRLNNKWTLNAYGAVEYFDRSGKSLHGHQRTSLWSLPVNLGLKPTYEINANMQYYFAVGPRYFYLHQHNRSHYVSKNRSRNGLGFFINTGLNYALNDHFTLDIFGEYSYAKTHFHSGKVNVYTRNIQVGGFTFGGGLGYKF